MPERMTRQLIAVLAAMMSDPEHGWYGLELMRTTGLKSGTLYPLLHRLVADGWLVKSVEAPSDRGGPERRLYRLTEIGEFAAHEITQRQNKTRETQFVLRPGFGAA